MPEIHPSDKKQGLHPSLFSRVRVDSIENSPADYRETDGKCESQGKPYDEEVYLNSLRRRGSQLGAALAPATGLGWQTVAGFQRLSENNA